MKTHKDQVWPTLDAINDALRCPKPLAGGDGCHWWYNDAEALEAHFADSLRGPDFLPIICKTCGLKLKLSADAPEYPDV